MASVVFNVAGVVPFINEQFDYGIEREGFEVLVRLGCGTQSNRESAWVNAVDLRGA